MFEAKPPANLRIRTRAECLVSNSRVGADGHSVYQSVGASNHKNRDQRTGHRVSDSRSLPECTIPRAYETSWLYLRRAIRNHSSYRLISVLWTNRGAAVAPMIRSAKSPFARNENGLADEAARFELRGRASLVVATRL